MALFRAKGVIGEDWIVGRTVIATSLRCSIAFLRRSASETFQLLCSTADISAIRQVQGRSAHGRALGRSERQIWNLTIGFTEHAPLTGCRPSLISRGSQNSRKTRCRMRWRVEGRNGKSRRHSERHGRSSFGNACKKRYSPFGNVKDTSLRSWNSVFARPAH